MCKGGIAGLAWLALPFWLFVLAGAALYFVPLFDPGRFAFLFFLFLAGAFFLPEGIASGAVVGVLFGLLVGMKDLVLVHRSSAYRVFIGITFLIACSNFFGAPGDLGAFALFFLACVTGILFSTLIMGFLRYDPSTKRFTEEKRSHALLAAFLGGMFIAELSLALLFLPLRIPHQTAILFLSGVVLFELFFAYTQNAFSRRGLLALFSLFFTFTVVILTMNDWKF